MNFMESGSVFRLMDAHKDGPYLFGVDFELSQGFFVPDPMRSKDILWRVGDFSNFDSNQTRQGGSRFEAHPMSFDEFEAKFCIVHRALMHGESFLANLTIKSELDTDFTLEEIAMRCTSPYLLMVPDKFVCFSPETFVRINEERVISSNPMKGTIDASIPNAMQDLLDDSKERSEHNTVVDLIRNDLSIVADGVSVKRFRYAELLHTSSGDIIQTSSMIQGRLQEQQSERVGETIARLLPAGSVSGAPKRSTLNIISEAEQMPRGFYCGVFGYCDGRSLDAAVMIRFIEQQSDGKKYFRSGSGITANSSARAEYDEMIKKIYLPFQLQ